MSSDALLMNVACHPGFPIGELFGGMPDFGVGGAVPVVTGAGVRADRTELDLVVRGDRGKIALIAEAKLTEADFTTRSVDHVRRYADIDLFDLDALASNESVRHYQLIRNVLAAHYHDASFVLFHDARRPDLADAFDETLAAVRHPTLAARCTRMSWQGLAASAPEGLRTFLAGKYGIEAGVPTSPPPKAPTILPPPASRAASLPLVELAGRREYQHARHLASTIADLRLDEIAAAWDATRERAPRRPARNKTFLGSHNGSVNGVTNRLEEHLAMALVNDRHLLQVGHEQILPVDYQTPLKAARSDAGVGKIDILGVGVDEGRLWTIELKMRRGRRGDTPLRALLEGLAYTAIVEANRSAIADELRAAGHHTVDALGGLLVAAPSDYWEAWDRLAAAGEWRPPLKALSSSLSERLGFPIALCDLGPVTVAVVDGRPRVAPAN